MLYDAPRVQVKLKWETAPWTSVCLLIASRSEHWANPSPPLERQILKQVHGTNRVCFFQPQLHCCPNSLDVFHKTSNNVCIKSNTITWDFLHVSELQVHGTDYCFPFFWGGGGINALLTVPASLFVRCNYQWDVKTGDLSSTSSCTKQMNPLTAHFSFSKLVKYKCVSFFSPDVKLLADVFGVSSWQTNLYW